MRTDTMVKLCDEYQELNKQISELEHRVDEIKSKLKDELSERGEDQVIAGPYTISNTSVVSKRFDSKTFKNEYGSLYENYLKESVTTRFSIK